MNALASGSAMAARSHVVTSLGRQLSLVSWQCETPPDLSNVSMEDVRTYLFFLENEHYSFVGADGSIVQMSFKIHRGKIVHHRLCYLPCPVSFDRAELREESLYTIVERNLHSKDYEQIRYRGGLRFDFDPEAASKIHPSSHLTLNFDSVRIPVGRSLDAMTFLSFIDEHFFATRSDLNRFELSIAQDETPDVLSLENKAKPHISWAIN